MDRLFFPYWKIRFFITFLRVPRGVQTYTLGNSHPPPWLGSKLGLLGQLRTLFRKALEEPAGAPLWMIRPSWISPIPSPGSSRHFVPCIAGGRQRSDLQSKSLGSSRHCYCPVCVWASVSWSLKSGTAAAPDESSCWTGFVVEGPALSGPSRWWSVSFSLQARGCCVVAHLFEIAFQLLQINAFGSILPGVFADKSD